MTGTDNVAFGRYQLEAKLATGGMGEIFLARMMGPHGIEKKVVIKRVLPHLSNAIEFVQRFLDEGRLVVQLSHGNIVQVFEMGQEGDDYLLAMEYVDGVDLRALMRRMQEQNVEMPADLAARIVTEVAKGLAYAHSRCDESGANLGIIHRDVSPSNIMVSRDGDVKLVDFGIAKASSRMSESISGSLHGKFLYMSPEQAAGQSLDSRSDLFALGICFYEMLTGKRPFVGDTEIETLRLIQNGSYVPLADLRSDIPERLVAIVDRCLEVEKDVRYSTAEQVNQDVMEFFLASGRIVSNTDLSDFAEPYFGPRTPSQSMGLDAVLAHQIDGLIATPSTQQPDGTQLASAESGLPFTDTLPRTPSELQLKDSGTTSRSRVHALPETEVRRSSRQRILIASIVLLIGLLVTLNVVTLGELEKRSRTQVPVDEIGALALTEEVQPAVSSPTETKVTDSSPGNKKETEKATDTTSAEEPKRTPEKAAGAQVAEVPETKKTKAASTPEENVIEALDKAAAPSEMSLLLVTSPKEVVITIDDQVVGPGSDGKVMVPAGTGSFTLKVKADGHREFSEVIERAPGVTKHITAMLAYLEHTVLVRTVPADASIVVRGREVAKGSHRVSVTSRQPVWVKIKRTGYDARVIKLTHDGRRNVAVTLKPSSIGTLELRVMPATAVVEVDGRVVKEASVQKNRVSVKIASGSHVLVVKSANGTKQVRRKFEINSGETTKMGEISLVRE